MNRLGRSAHRARHGQATGQRRARIAAGEKPIGWKVGLGAKPAMERLKITMPVVGYMMQKSIVPNGSTVSVAGWAQPVAEPEIAVHMAADLASGAGRDADHRGDRRARPGDRAG